MMVRFCSLAALLALAGCAGSLNPTSTDIAPTASSADRFRIIVRESQDRLDVAGADDLTMAAFVDHWRRHGAGPLELFIADEEGREAVRSALIAQGAPEAALVLREPGSDEAPSIRFSRYIAEPPRCEPFWSGNLYTPGGATPFPGFGCSTQANLAAMVSDPRDLIRARPVDPADSQLRQPVMADLRGRRE